MFNDFENQLLLLLSSFPIRARHSGFSFSSCFYQLYLPPSLQPNVMRVRVRPGGLASFGLRVSSDCDDATSIGTWGSPLLLPISVFYETPSQVWNQSCPSLRSLACLAWGRKVPSFRSVPRGGSARVLSVERLCTLEACNVYTKRGPDRDCHWNCESVPNEQQQQLQPLPCSLSPHPYTSFLAFPISSFLATPSSASFSQYTHHLSSVGVHTISVLPLEFSLQTFPPVLSLWCTHNSFLILSILVTPNDNRNIFNSAI